MVINVVNGEIVVKLWFEIIEVVWELWKMLCFFKNVLKSRYLEILDNLFEVLRLFMFFFINNIFILVDFLGICLLCLCGMYCM